MSTNTRRLAARAIMQVVNEGRSLTVVLDELLRKSPLTPQDQSFTKALCYGVCRFYHRLEFISGLLATKPVKDLDVKILILIGLFQIIYMRVKPHAAVSETVQAANKQAPWARGLINAVLRSYLRAQEDYEAQADKVNNVKYSHPAWLCESIVSDWPEHADAILAANNQPPPLTLRVNLSKISRMDYLALLTAKNVASEILPYSPSAILISNPVAVESLPGYEEGWFSVQDAAAQLAADLLAVNPGDRVLDVCAAPGGKTAHLLELQSGLKELVAIDIDDNRMQRVKHNLNRLKLNAKLVIGDATHPDTWWDGKLFDRILLDAPCSATGVIRRHPDIKLLRRPDDIAATVQLQKQILNAIWPLLTPGGVLLYATCSILKQENSRQVQDFLSNHADAVELPINSVSWGIPEQCGRQILTGESSTDGFYYARIFKK